MDAAARDQAWTQILAERERFLGYLRRHAPEVAEELLQEALAKGFERLADVEALESPEGWFQRVLTNHMNDHFRRRAREAKALDALAEEPRDEHHPAPGEAKRPCRCVTRHVEALHEEQAKAIRMVDVEERSVAEYAASAGITSNNARVRLHRARRALKDKVVAGCGACAAEGCTDCSCAQA